MGARPGVLRGCGPCARYCNAGNISDAQWDRLGCPDLNAAQDLARSSKSQWREYYFDNRSTLDIERQAKVEPEFEYAEPTVALSIPERADLASYICGRVEDTLLQRQIPSIDLMVSLCGKRETRKRVHPKSRWC